MSTADAVRAQYEALPFPPCDPDDEAKRLVRTWLDDLPMINHYCFAGRQTFDDGFRVLVAGGGTGDATIFLAEQLRATNAEIVHVDLSQASVAIARERAKRRALANITFVHDSLLALPRLGLGTFDYINCSGVLHHLDDPDAGIDALLSVRKPDGALGLMVYATYGRAGVYQLQALLRLIADATQPIDERLATARRVLAALPPTHAFRHSGVLRDGRIPFGDAGMFDLLLHPRDRAYTVREVYEWIADRHALHIELTDVQRGRSSYEPALWLGPDHASLIDTMSALPARQRHEAAELLSGSITQHVFYATRSPACRAPYGDADYVPFLFHEPVTGAQLAALVQRHGDRPFPLAHQHTGIRVIADPGRYGRHILALIDGERTFGDIFDAVRAGLPSGEQPTNEALFADLKPFYDVLAAIDRVLLRHRACAQPR